MKQPIYSVVMPVYNVEAYVAEAIQSVLDQSLEDFELLVVVDGSTDGSLEICRSFEDPRIRIIEQENRGLAGARNSGIAAARGSFFAFLDSDDRFHPEKLRLHYIHLCANPEVGVSYAGSRLIDGGGRVLGVAMRPRLTGITPGHVLKRNPVGNGSAAVIRREVFDLVRHEAPEGHPAWFDERFRQSEDIDLWVRLAGGHGVRFEGIEGQLTDYRIVAGGLSANIVRQYLSWERMLRKAEDYAPLLVDQHGARARAYQLRYLARRAIQMGDPCAARKLLREALGNAPGILLSEPRKTLTTMLATLAALALGPRLFGRLSQPFLKGAATCA
ncbi:glycosyltransferase family 2 protein [Sphingomicrobium astaxanthinifaciens]|uniref:glycosyltransferase family 2 protein n=1 Tax=Sphingomicrobium astaxanthinifaciens TaxID=1227949 RepID=UPI001FCB2F45|nr:glycosyltransferase family A protein [Sphingomicrobium astaxanthinifaciens]MCJ7420511.1 glycosyltransferase family 2 protein [Sphingomicrobium astaxanthinifaciens]